MDIFIYGTKDGARPFHQTSQGAASVFDDCRGFGNGKSKGQTAYSIEYTKSGVALTKWIIVDDTLRGSIGFIAFAIEVEKDKILEGRKVKVLLDELLSTYKANYLTDRFEIKEVNEVWDFVNNLKQNYQSQLRHLDPKDAYSRGEKDAAFIYYSSEEELQEYLDLPYQEDYKFYKRIFLIDLKYRDQEENPLKALRHNGEADLTGREILKNLRYRVYIQESDSGISTIATTAGKRIQNREEVHPRDSINIIFSKKNYEDDGLKGSIVELKEMNDARVIVDENNKELSVRPPNKLIPKTKSISFNIRNWKNEPIENPEITLKGESFGNNKKSENNKVTFEGDELDQEWEVKINGKSEKIFTPKTSDNLLTIEIKEEKIVKFKVEAPDYTISIRNGSSKNVEVLHRSKEIKFINEAIDKNWTFTIAAVGYKGKEESFCPRDIYEPKVVTLEKKKRLKYFIEAEKCEIAGTNYLEIDEGEHLDHNKIKKKVKLPKGMLYKATPFVITNPEGNSNGVIKVQFEKKTRFYKNWKFISAVGLFLTVLLVGYFFRGHVFPFISVVSNRVEKLLQHGSDDSPKDANEIPVIEMPDSSVVQEEGTIKKPKVEDEDKPKDVTRQKPEEQEPAPKQNVIQEKTEVTPTTPVSQDKAEKAKEREAQFESEFWLLIHSANKNKSDYNKLYIEYSNISWNNKTKDLLDKIIKSFSSFDVISDMKLKKVENIDQLVKLIDDQK